MATRRKAAHKQVRVLTPAEAERKTKQAARRRRVVIELTEDQLARLAKEYRTLKPTEAAELVFTVKKRPFSRLKIAGYSYWGDTCCV